MAKQVPLDSSGRAGREAEGDAKEVAPDLACERLAIVNVAYFGAPDATSRDWVLIDAGVAGVGATGRIIDTAAARFGEGTPPAAIIMTHGHFDHIGALEELADHWEAPVYAHELELPFLNGSAAYPPPDPSVGGGMMAKLAGFYPRGPIDVGRRLQPLPADGSVPEMPGWQWIHTPGHTPGHVSLWREDDRALIAGDAFITTRQESAYAVATQKPEMHGPPMYYTQDWKAARASVEQLAALDPELVVTGHGPAMHGGGMREALRTLSRQFDRLAVPEEGYYVNAPARPGSGAYRLPDGD